MIRCKLAKYQAMLAAAKKAGNKAEAGKLEVKVKKAEEEMRKSTQSFKDRGASEQN